MKKDLLGGGVPPPCQLDLLAEGMGDPGTLGGAPSKFREFMGIRSLRSTSAHGACLRAKFGYLVDAVRLFAPKAITCKVRAETETFKDDDRLSRVVAPSWHHLGPFWRSPGPPKKRHPGAILGHLGAVLEHLSVILVSSWALLPPSCIFGHLGPILGYVGAILAHLGAFWYRLGALLAKTLNRPPLSLGPTCPSVDIMNVSKALGVLGSLGLGNQSPRPGKPKPPRFVPVSGLGLRGEGTLGLGNVIGSPND